MFVVINLNQGNFFNYAKMDKRSDLFIIMRMKPIFRVKSVLFRFLNWNRAKDLDFVTTYIGLKIHKNFTDIIIYIVQDLDFVFTRNYISQAIYRKCQVWTFVIHTYILTRVHSRLD